jgi:glycogen operon protein
MYYKPLEFTLPVLPKGYVWFRVADTSLASPDDIVEPGQEVLLSSVKTLTLAERSSIILLGKPDPAAH